MGGIPACPGRDATGAAANGEASRILLEGGDGFVVPTVQSTSNGGDEAFLLLEALTEAACCGFGRVHPCGVVGPGVHGDGVGLGGDGGGVVPGGTLIIGISVSA